MSSRVARPNWRSHLLRICAAALVMLVIGCRGRQRVSGVSTDRLVSLSPAITETLFAIGAGSFVVGVSDYCRFPPIVQTLPHLGSGYTPRHEAIVALAPTTVFVEAVNTQTSSDLARVLDVKALPWLTLEQVAESTRTIGHVTHRVAAAEDLVRHYETAMQSRVSADSPRILLVLAHSPGQLREVWFIRRNSIHGRVIEAAGAVNAAPTEINGPPHLSLEQVVRLDPDGVVILQSAPQGDPQLVNDWMQLRVLTAVKNRRVELIAAPEWSIPGPRIVNLVQRLSPLIQAWRKKP